MNIDLPYLLSTMRRLIDTPSPVGYYDAIKPVIESFAAELGYTVTYDNRDTAYITVEGHDTSRTVCVSAHADTLGFMVRGINPDGTLRLRALGGINFANVEGENVTVHTLSLKKGSRITLEGSAIPGEEEVSAMLDQAEHRLRGEGYAPYYLYRQKFISGGFENVGWAKECYVNLYNICIMEELCSILAMGGGGSTKLIAPGNGRNIRLMAPKYPLEYIQKIRETCEEKRKISEFFVKEED